MNLSDFARMPKEEVKDYLRSEGVEFIEEATKEDLVAIARQHFVKGINAAEEKAATEPDAAKAGKAVETEQTPRQKEESEDRRALNAMDELKKMGFETRQQAISYLDGITRERKMLEFRQTEFSEAERIAAEREAKLDAREKYLDAKGIEVLAKVQELKDLTEKQQENIQKLSRLNSNS